MNVIVKISTYGSAAHEKRRNENINSAKSLDDLTKILQEEYGFTISRSGCYLRLLPKRSNTSEGKRHVNTVPVKLAKAQTDLHKNHVDAAFASSTIRHLEEIASFLGPREIFFLSQDDKARVPIGITGH